VIIYSGGYNLNKRRFFQNFLYIALFGVFGTILSFSFILLLTYYVNEAGWVTKWSTGSIIHLNMYQVMIFSATICATDSVAGLTMINPEKYPKLFSVVFGEGMVNDAVSIIIFLSVGNMTGSDNQLEEFTFMILLQMLGQFVKGFVLSIVIGALIGLFTTWMFRTMRFLTHSCILETGIIIYMGYASFTLCEMVQLSGVISVLVTGIILAHYNLYNLSGMGLVSSK
jgi:sodium/hydrogen exchanger-like protein 6/7/sodium/hydrogen exchanger 8